MDKSERKFIQVKKKIKISSFLKYPHLFRCVGRAAIIKHVLVILQGPPGSGKSTVAKNIKKVLETSGAVGMTTEIHSTDQYFMRDFGYFFEHNKLSEYHEQNFKAACASKARVVIIDNTNLTTTAFNKYRWAMPRRICIIISMREQTFESLYRRGVHGVPIETLERMIQDYTPVKYNYISTILDPKSSQKIRNNFPSIQSDIIDIGRVDMRPGFEDNNFRKERIESLGSGFKFTIIGTCILHVKKCVIDEKISQITHIITKNDDGILMIFGLCDVTYYPDGWFNEELQELDREKLLPPIIPCEPFTISGMDLPLFPNCFLPGRVGYF
jgi:DNA polymerase III delta prime subunit